jgi:hypothetical protein
MGRLMGQEIKNFKRMIRHYCLQLFPSRQSIFHTFRILWSQIGVTIKLQFTSFLEKHGATSKSNNQ